MSERPALRALIFVIGGLETAAVLALLFLLDPFGTSDPLGRSIAVGLSLMLAAPYVTLVAPALLLAAVDRFLPLALALTVLALIAALSVWGLA